MSYKPSLTLIQVYTFFPIHTSDSSVSSPDTVHNSIIVETKVWLVGKTQDDTTLSLILLCKETIIDRRTIEDGLTFWPSPSSWKTRGKQTIRSKTMGSLSSNGISRSTKVVVNQGQRLERRMRVRLEKCGGMSIDEVYPVRREEFPSVGSRSYCVVT